MLIQLQSSTRFGLVLATMVGILLPLAACNRNPVVDVPNVGGGCKYETFKGVGTVTAVKVIDNGGQPATLVDFDWKSEAKDVQSESMRLAIEELKAGDKEAAHRDMIVGSRHELVLEQIVSGTCTPHIWTYVGPAK